MATDFDGCQLTVTASPHRRPWLVLVGCFLLAAGFNAYVFAPASVVPLLVETFGVDTPAAGLSISAVFLGWVLLQLPGGLLMDRYDNRLLVWVGSGLLLAVAVAGYLAPNYPTFLITRFLGGGAAVFLWTANANIVDRVFPESSRALGTGVFIASAPAGVSLAQAAGPLVAATVGWRGTLLVYQTLVLAGLPLFTLLLREPVQNDSPLSPRAFLTSLRDRDLVLIAVSSFSAYSLFVFFNAWMPSYGTDVVGLELSTAGALAALVPAVGLVARPGGGWLSDRLGGRRRPVLVATFIIVVPALVGVTIVSSVAGFGAFLLLAGLGSQLGTGVFYVLVGERSDASTRGTSLAVLTTLSIGGALTAPVLTGWLIDAFSWDAAFLYALLLAGLGILTISAVPES